MYLKIFNIPIPDLMGEENRVNVFMRGHRVLKRTVHVGQSGDLGYVTVVLEYCEGHGMVRSHRKARRRRLMRSISKARSAC